MKKVPGTTALCVVTLAFGIAAATTTFSAVYAAVLRPIPFAEPARLLLLQHTRQNAKSGTVGLRWSVPGAGGVLLDMALPACSWWHLGVPRG